MEVDICQYCRIDPYEWVNNGLGGEPVAVTCCARGEMKYAQGLSDELIDIVYHVNDWGSDDGDT